MSVQTTGIPHAADSARTSSSAPEATTPPPTYRSGPPRPGNQARHGGEHGTVRLGGRVRGARLWKGVDVDDGLLHVLGHVDEDRALPAGKRHAEGFRHHLQQLCRRADQEVVLRHRNAHAVRIDFLEGIRADQARRDLACHRDNGHGVELGVGDRGEQVHRARARGGEARCRVPRGPGHSLRQEPACLLVADKDVAQIALSQRVVEREVCPPGYPCHDPYSLPLEKLDQERRAVPLHDSSLRKIKKPLSVFTERGLSVPVDKPTVHTRTCSPGEVLRGPQGRARAVSVEGFGSSYPMSNVHRPAVRRQVKKSLSTRSWS